MTKRRTKVEVLDRDFLGIRAKILELAAALDRLDHAASSDRLDPRFEKISQGINALKVTGTERALTVQKIFSVDYDPEWRTHFNMESSRDLP